MIVTVTPNPSIDRTIEIDRLERGGLNRARRSTAEAAGKGVNVSCALAMQGVATVAVVALAQDSASTYLRLLADAVPIAGVPIAGSIRTNVSVVEADGTLTKLNEPGPTLTSDDVDAILVAASGVSRASWVVGCGSLPPGAPVDFYARLAAGASPGRRVAIDTSSEALGAAVCAGVALIKPNLDELEALVVAKTLAGELSPARAVAAVGGIEAAADGLRALVEGRFAGKIVIFPQLRGLPLTSLEDLAVKDPELASALGPGETWNTDAEAVLFAKHLEPTPIAST